MLNSSFNFYKWLCHYLGAMFDDMIVLRFNKNTKNPFGQLFRFLCLSISKLVSCDFQTSNTFGPLIFYSVNNF